MIRVGTAGGAASVLLVGLNPESMGMVRETLAAEAVLPERSISFGDALGAVRTTRPDLIVVGFTESKDAALSLGETLAKEFPNLKLVALANEAEASTTLAAMRVGYRDFFMLPDDSERLRAIVHEAAFSTDDEEENGLVVSFIGAKGGVGTTTITCHLAAELAGIHRVICLDLDFQMGDVASLLDVSPKDTIADLLPRADRLDERMLTGSIAVHRSKAHVLAQPNDLDKIGEFHPDDIYNIILTSARGYMYVLIDAGSQCDEASLMALQVSDMIVMVTTPDVISVRDAYRRIKYLETQGVERERIKLIVNRSRKGAFISNADIETNLQMQVAASIADDPETVERATNEGQLIREINRKSKCANDISNLVALLTDDDDDDDDDDNANNSGGGGGFFSRFFGSGS